MNVKPISGALCAKTLIMVALSLPECHVSSADTNQYYKVIKLRAGVIYQGALIPSESTNLAAEIVIFDCQARVKRGPLRGTDGYQWVRLQEKPCGGSFVILAEFSTKQLRNENPGFWTISDGAVAYVASDNNEAIIISTVDLADTNILNRITNSFAVNSSWSHEPGNMMVKYSFKESGSGSKTLSFCDPEGRFEKQLGLVHLNNKKAYYQIKSAAKID